MKALRHLTVMVEQQDEIGNKLSETRVTLDVNDIERGYPQNVGVAVRPLMPGVEGVFVSTSSPIRRKRPGTNSPSSKLSAREANSSHLHGRRGVIT